MEKIVDELHNKEDTGTFMKAIGIFLALVLGLGFLGIIFWSAF